MSKKPNNPLDAFMRLSAAILAMSLCIDSYGLIYASAKYLYRYNWTEAFVINYISGVVIGVYSFLLMEKIYEGSQND